MTISSDYKKFAILYVDDEEKSLTNFTRAFEDQFRIYTASSAQLGLKILAEHGDDIGLVLTDQRMPGEKGVWLLEKARQFRPQIIRILATAYTDTESAIEAVNLGAVYRYVSKPWNPPELETTLKRGLELFTLQRERDQLLNEKKSALQNMMIADRIISIGLLASGMSHHIRNSLVSVKTFLELVPSKLQEEKVDLGHLQNVEFWTEYHQSAQAQIVKIDAMLKDLWVAAEKPTLNFIDPVSLREVIAAALEKSRATLAAKNISVENNVPDSLPPLLVDRPKFHKLFELLLKDEIVSVPPGSRIVFSAEPAGAEVRVRMSDDGPGLPKEALHLLFDPFQVRSDSPQEYGINLMACYFIVHYHGGKIEATSEEGKGTVFTLTLPTGPGKNPADEDHAALSQKLLAQDARWAKLTSPQ